MIRPVFSTDPMQPNQTRLMPVYSSGPMQPRQDVQSFDLTRNSGPSRSLVTGDRRLTRNPNGRMGAPQMDAMGERIGSRGMTPLRRMEIAARRGDMRANELLFRAQAGLGGMGMGGMAPRGYGQPQAAPQGYGQPAPGMPANNNQPLPAPLDPLANLPPPATTEQALGMLGYGPTAAAEANTEQPLLPPLNLPWTGQPLPGGVPMGQLPPSTMNGATGLPPLPRFSEVPAGGMNIIVDNQTGKQVAAFKPEPAQPRPLDNDELRRIREAGFRSTGVFLPNGQPQLEPMPQPVPTERVTESPTGTTRTYTQPRGQPPAAPTVSPQDRVNKLMEKAGMQATASTQTGQMPNANYAAPINPAQLLDEARNEYARTGNDAALKQYFAQYPSEAVQFTMGALNPAPQGGPRVMTQAEALRSLQPQATPAPITSRPAAPSLIRSGPGTGIVDDFRRFANYARNNPLIELRR